MVDSSSFVISALLSPVVADEVKVSVSALLCCIVVCICVPSVSFGVVAGGKFGSVVEFVLSVVECCVVDIVESVSVAGWGVVVGTSVV